MKVEKLAKNGEKGQNYHPLSPGRYVVPVGVALQACATFELRPHAVVALTG